MLLKMTRVQIIGAQDRLNETVAALHRLGVVHLDDVTGLPEAHTLTLDVAATQLQEDLVLLQARLDALLGLLPTGLAGEPPAEAHPPLDATTLAGWVRERLDRLAPSVQALALRRDELHAEAVSLPRYEDTLRKLAPLTVELTALQGYDTAALLIDRRIREVLDIIRVEVERATQGQYDLITHDVDEHTTAALLVYPRPQADAVAAILGQENITQVRLPAALQGRTFRDSLAALTRRKQAIQDEQAHIEAELKRLSRVWRETLSLWRREIANRIQELGVHARFGATDYTFVIQGWVPRRELDRLRAGLAQQAGRLVVVEELPIAPDEQHTAPIAFANPAPLRPFETLVRLMAVPRPGELDPTPLMAVFFPLFFGIMLGDVGYGALLLALALYLRRRFRASPTVHDLAMVWVYGALWAILFGVLYGEFLGELGEALGMRPLWMARDATHISALFGFTLALGVLQVVLGLVLGLWGAWRERESREVMKKGGALAALAAIFGLIGAAAGLLPSAFFTPSVVALLVGLTLLIIPAGPIGLLLGPLEALETVGNVLSYLRLAAIGLSSVYLALVANELGGLMGNVVLGVIVALLLHALNFALGMLSPTIQSLRLHYVEFFRQFYQGGGHEYRPFKLD